MYHTLNQIIQILSNLKFFSDLVNTKTCGQRVFLCNNPNSHTLGFVLTLDLAYFLGT